MGSKLYGVFMAAGSGTRMGSATPKQFLQLGGRPILQRTIEAFLEAEPDLTVITVLPREFFGLWKDLCVANSLDCPQILVAGGLTRFLSVRNALSKVPDGAVAAIQDGVRPLPSVQLIRSLFDRMSECRAVVPVMPVVDTLRSIDPSTSAPDRSRVVSVQTPQIFRSEDLKKAYARAFDTTFTDDASVVTAAGLPLTLVDGERTNIKITTPDDLVLAEAILSLRR